MGFKDYDTDDLILTLARLYCKETKKAFKDAEAIAKVLLKRGVIDNLDYFMEEWRK